MSDIFLHWSGDYCVIVTLTKDVLSMTDSQLIEAIRGQIAKMPEQLPVEMWTPKKPNKKRQAIIDRDKSTCRYCLRVLDPEKDLIELDHIIPQALGGKSTAENLVVACGDCNRKKGGRTPEAAGMILRGLENA